MRKLGLIMGVAALVLSSAVLLASCSKPNVLTSGTVIDKRYDDPDDWYVSGYTIDGGQTCTGGYADYKGNPQPRVCVNNPDTVIPGHWEHDGPHWSLRIQGPTLDGKPPIREWHSVTETVYDSLRIGDRWEA